MKTPPGEGAQRSAILESVLPEDRLEDSKRTATEQESFGLVTKTEQAVGRGLLSAIRSEMYDFIGHDNSQNLVTEMANEELDRLESFRVFIKAAEEGGAIPTVDEDDLRRLDEMCADMTKRYCGKDGIVSLEAMARACSPDANLPAVWLRHTQLRSLSRQGILAEWQQGTTLDDAVFRVAATIPMNGIHFDQEAFVQHLRAGSAA